MSDLERVLQEIVRRQEKARIKGSVLGKSVGDSTGEGDILLEHLHDRQKRFVLDESQRKAAVCSRRAGKTEAIATMLCRNAINRAYSVQAYVAPTRGQAKQLLWPMLKKRDRHYKLGVKFNETELYCTFPNGSTIFLAGADKRPDIDRLRGLALLAVVLDEGQSFREHLRQLIVDVLAPALEDYNGSVALIGTPGRLLSGMFYEVTEGNLAQIWSQHRWTCHEHNAFFPRWSGRDTWKEEAKLWLEDVKRKNGFTNKSPTFIREYLGKWYRDESSLVYKLGEDNYFDKLPGELPWHAVLGVDLGYTSASAFVIGCYNARYPNVYYPYSMKKSGMSVSDVAEQIRSLQARWKISKTVVDAGGLGKMMIEEFRTRHGLKLMAAQKVDKWGAIESMNDDMVAGKIKVVRGSALAQEWLTLQKTLEGEEDTRQANHCADAALYVHRECRHFRFKPFFEEAKPGSREWIDREMAEYEQALIDKINEPREDIDGMWERYGIDP